MTPQALLSLDDDVLSYIISDLTFRDAVTLSLTCKEAYKLSLDPALRRVVLTRSEDQLKSFRTFLLAKNSRPLFVKSLHISTTITWDLEPGDAAAKECATAIADILEAVVNLRAFSCGAMHTFHYTDRRIEQALIALPHLVDLSLLEAGPGATIYLLAKLNARDLPYLTLDIIPTGSAKFDELFGGLSRFPRLESLTVSRLPGIFIRLPDTPRTEVILPSLRELVLHVTFVPLVLLAAAFPNVSRVQLEFARAPNTFKLSPPPLRPEWLQPGWGAVDEVAIDSRDLAMWPLQCRVRVLDLGVVHERHQALAAVGGMRPRVLRCASVLDDGVGFWGMLATTSGAHELRFIEARIHEVVGHRKDEFVCHLGGFRDLTAVFICIRAYRQPTYPRAEALGTAQKLASRNGTMRFVGVSFADGTSKTVNEPIGEDERHDSIWYAVRREDRASGVLVQPMEIPTEVGLRLRDYMCETDYGSGWEERLATIG
ncbi:hypothetical protein BD413DRAFT_681925 [Trametes elegans]|nr:hypothetical protein BD413DRAFT_681925 [Trametes elegans]